MGCTILDEQDMQIMNSERTIGLDELGLSGWKSERTDYSCAGGSNQVAAVESSHPTRHGQTHKTTRGGKTKQNKHTNQEKGKKKTRNKSFKQIK